MSSSKNYGLTSLEEDFQAIGLTIARPEARGGDELSIMESDLARRFGGSQSRSTALSRMQSLAESRQPASRQQASRPASRPAANRGRIQESLAGFQSRLAVPTAFTGRQRAVAESSGRTLMLAERVAKSVAELHAVNRFEAVKAWANVSVISEMYARRLAFIAKRLGESKIASVGAQFGKLAGRAATIAEALRGKKTVTGLQEKFSQASAYVIAGTHLYAGLTEGPDAPFPVSVPGGPGQAPMGGPPALGTEGDDTISLDPAMGAATPTQGVEGMGGMGMGMGMEGEDPMGGMGGGPGGGAPPANDPLGLGGMGGPAGQPPRAEAMDPSLRYPYELGAENPDLDNDVQEGGFPPPAADDGNDPLGLGAQ